MNTLRIATGILALILATLVHATDTLGPSPFGASPAGAVPSRPAATTVAPSAPPTASSSVGMGALIDNAAATHSAAHAVVAQNVANGRDCVALVRAGVIAKTATAQYRCIVMGPRAAEAAARAGGQPGR